MHLAKVSGGDASINWEQHCDETLAEANGNEKKPAFAPTKLCDATPKPESIQEVPRCMCRRCKTKDESTLQLSLSRQWLHHQCNNERSSSSRCKRPTSDASPAR
mmetsp:Transcript_34632/g.96692  ORF Transcript_34632/g.96692 Transcript_34632/m.96692 type:complete len:104 (-) Transcript_34632:359-670(-)